MEETKADIQMSHSQVRIWNVNSRKEFWKTLGIHWIKDDF